MVYLFGDFWFHRVERISPFYDFYSLFYLLFVLFHFYHLYLLFLNPQIHFFRNHFAMLDRTFLTRIQVDLVERHSKSCSCILQSSLSIEHVNQHVIQVRQLSWREVNSLELWQSQSVFFWFRLDYVLVTLEIKHGSIFLMSQPHRWATLRFVVGRMLTKASSQHWAISSHLLMPLQEPIDHEL